LLSVFYHAYDVGTGSVCTWITLDARCEYVRVVRVLGPASEIVTNAYYNRYVGLHLPFPPNWHLAGDIEVSELVADGSRAMGLGDPAAKTMIPQMRGKVLVVASSHRLESDFSGFNRNMGVLAIDVRGHRDVVRTGEDYCRLVAEGIRTARPDAVISEIGLQLVAGEEFYKFDVELRVEGIPTFQRQLAGVANDYVVVISTAAESQAVLDELGGLADGIRFASVPEAVDSGPEGQCFRQEASVAMGEPEPPPSATALRVGGLILMVGSVLMLARASPTLALIAGGALFDFFVLKG